MRAVALAAVGVVLLGVGILLSDDRTGVATALIVIGAGQITVGLLLPRLSELEIGPRGFKLTLRERDAEFAPVLEREGSRLTQLAAFLAASTDGAPEAAEEALARTYAELHGQIDPGAQAKRHLVEVAAEGAREPSSAEAKRPDGDAWPSLAEALATLPAASRAAVVLGVYDGMSEQRIAELLGKPAEVVSEKLAKAERELAAILERAA